jgi:maltokinase
MSDIDDALAGWLPKQRWFGGKGRAVTAVRVAHEERLPGDADIRHTLLEVTADGGEAELYQLLLGYRDGDEVDARVDAGLVGHVKGQYVYDALHGHEGPGALLRLMTENRALSRLTFVSTRELDPALSPRVMGAEQSNTSVVFGEDYILKLFRRVQPGINPDLEVTRALAEAGSPYVPAPLGWLEGTVDGEPTTLAMLQTFERSATDGWAMATASVRDLFAEADLHADEVGGDFAAESERLGTATAEVHALLAQVLPSRTAGPGESAATAQQLVDRFGQALQVVPDLAPYADGVRAVYAHVGNRTAPVPVQRVHGDYHLGQVLHAGREFVIIDFEGEPSRSPTERRIKRGALTDVAGMMRSFQYARVAALRALEERGLLPPELRDAMTRRGRVWQHWVTVRFLAGYLDASAGAPFVPADRDDVRSLLTAYTLDKALYEVRYELNNRPDWSAIPLRGVLQLIQAEEAAPS